MARRRTSALAVRTVPMFQPRQAAPIIRIATPRAPTTTKRKAPRRRSHKGGSDGSLMQWGLAGLVIGLAEKAGIMDNIPEIPLIGRKGAAALGLSYFAKGHPLAQRAAKGLALLAAYEYGKTGSVSGDD